MYVGINHPNATRVQFTWTEGGDKTPRVIHVAYTSGIRGEHVDCIYCRARARIP